MIEVSIKLKNINFIFIKKIHINLMPVTIKHIFHSFQ